MMAIANDKIPLRVKFDLERAQRILQGTGLDEEEMELSEKSLAASIMTIIQKDSPKHSYFLASLADALDNPDSEYRLVLKRKRGNRLNPHEKRALYLRDVAIYLHIEASKKDQVKLNAAVGEVAIKFAVSPATVWAALKRMDEQSKSDGVISLLTSAMTLCEKTDDPILRAFRLEVVARLEAELRQSNGRIP